MTTPPSAVITLPRPLYERLAWLAAEQAQDIEVLVEAVLEQYLAQQDAATQAAREADSSSPTGRREE